jgi:hypothetical protein
LYLNDPLLRGQSCGSKTLTLIYYAFACVRSAQSSKGVSSGSISCRSVTPSHPSSLDTCPVMLLACLSELLSHAKRIKSDSPSYVPCCFSGMSTTGDVRYLCSLLRASLAHDGRRTARFLLLSIASRITFISSVALDRLSLWCEL